MNKTPKTETWYCWRVYTTPSNENKPRLMVPWSDPRIYEFPFDFLYETPEKARDGLKTMDAEDYAFEEEWVLCRQTLEPISAKRAILFMKTDDGEQAKLAEETFIGLDNHEIERRIIEKHWDNRLTCASCSPVVTIEQIDISEQ